MYTSVANELWLIKYNGDREESNTHGVIVI